MNAGLRFFTHNIIITLIACIIIYFLSGGEVTRAQLSVAAMIIYFQVVSFGLQYRKN